MSRTLLLALLALAVGGCANLSTAGRVSMKDDNTSVSVAFSHGDRQLIEDYYKPAKKKKSKGMPPGLAKRGGDLPPGLAKRDSLPPGLAKRDKLPADVAGEPLPRELEARLSPLPGNYVRVRVGQDFVLMDRKTRVVFDVAYGLGGD